MQNTQLYKKHAMTLIELLVVIAILSVTATLVLESGLDNMVGQAQYDNTTTKAKMVEDAIVGANGRIGRFLEDVGRLPQYDDATAGEELVELWEDTADGGVVNGIVDWGEYSDTLVPSDLKSYAYTTRSPDATTSLEFDFSTVADSADVNGEATLSLSYGWNGPYIAIVGDTFENGFGENWVPLDDTYADASAGDPIYGLKSPEETSLGLYGSERIFKFTKSLISECRLKVTLKDLSNNTLIPWDDTFWTTGTNGGDNVEDRNEETRTFNYTRIFLVAPDSIATTPLISSSWADYDFTDWAFDDNDAGGSEHLTVMSSFTTTEYVELVPGRYKVFAYAYAIDDNPAGATAAIKAGTAYAAYASQVKEIVVYPGFNTHELQLTTDVKP